MCIGIPFDASNHHSFQLSAIDDSLFGILYASIYATKKAQALETLVKQKCKRHFIPSEVKRGCHYEFHFPFLERKLHKECKRFWCKVERCNALKNLGEQRSRTNENAINKKLWIETSKIHRGELRTLTLSKRHAFLGDSRNWKMLHGFQHTIVRHVLDHLPLISLMLENIFRRYPNTSIATSRPLYAKHARIEICHPPNEGQESSRWNWPSTRPQ